MNCATWCRRTGWHVRSVSASVFFIYFFICLFVLTVVFPRALLVAKVASKKSSGSVAPLCGFDAGSLSTRWCFFTTHCAGSSACLATLLVVWNSKNNNNNNNKNMCMNWRLHDAHKTCWLNSSAQPLIINYTGPLKGLPAGLYVFFQISLLFAHCSLLSLAYFPVFQHLIGHLIRS